jgi:Xaa-Pro aminopeptidase
VRRPRTDAPFVHVGRAGDPDLRWLVDASLPPEPCAYLRSPDDEPTLYAPAGTALGDVEGRVETTAGDPTVALADALPGSGVVYAPRHLPHDAALRVERAGHDLRSTTAVADARARKDERERAALDRAARAARAGVDRAREALTTGEDGDPVVAGAGGDRAPAEALRRRVASAVAGAGATPSVRVDGPLRAGSPVVVDATARVAGYHARVARTLVVGGDGGAVRRAQVAAESALQVAAGEATAGTEADWLADEVRAELGSFGVDVAAGVVVAGTGLARREAPLVGTDAALEAGNALVVAPAARVPESDAVVRLANTLVVEEDGPRVLGEG